MLQEGDGYDGSAFVADLLSLGGAHEEEAQARAALPSTTAAATLRDPHVTSTLAPQPSRDTNLGLRLG